MSKEWIKVGAEGVTHIIPTDIAGCVHMHPDGTIMVCGEAQDGSWQGKYLGTFSSLEEASRECSLDKFIEDLEK